MSKMDHIHTPSCCNSDRLICAGHDTGHVHGPGCGHKAVKHDDHIDYIVAGHLHHAHTDHCDNHGAVR